MMMRKARVQFVVEIKPDVTSKRALEVTVTDARITPDGLWLECRNAHENRVLVPMTNVRLVEEIERNDETF